MSDLSTIAIFAVTLFNVVALSVVALLMFVVTQATKDQHLKRHDSTAVKSSRKNSFYSAASYLILSIIFQDYWLIHPSVVATGLVVTGFIAGAGWVLAVSLVSMKSRAPPEGHEMPLDQPQASYSAAPSRIARVWRRIH